MFFRTLLLCLFTVFSSQAFANDFELVARANFFDGHQLPARSYITDSTPVLNDRGDLGFKVVSLGGENVQAIWFRSHDSSKGNIVYKAPNQRTLSNPRISSTGKLLFGQFDFGVHDGVFQYAPGDGVSLAVDPEDFPGAVGYDFAHWGANESIWFRHLSDRGFRSYVGQYRDGETVTMAREKETDISFIFKPNVSGYYHVVKMRMGEGLDDENPDRLRIYGPNGEIESIAEDRDSYAKSPYVAFDNSPAVSRMGHVAFAATLENETRAVFLFKNGVTKEIAREGKDLKKIEFFSPEVNIHGTVAFRAIGKNGERGIYVYREGELKRLVGEGDHLPSDLGKMRVFSGDSMPAFGGNITLNNRGELAFKCVLQQLDSEKTVGTGVYQTSVR